MRDVLYLLREFEMFSWDINLKKNLNLPRGRPTKDVSEYLAVVKALTKTHKLELKQMRRAAVVVKDLLKATHAEPITNEELREVLQYCTCNSFGYTEVLFQYHWEQIVLPPFKETFTKVADEPTANLFETWLRLGDLHLQEIIRANPNEPKDDPDLKRASQVLGRLLNEHVQLVKPKGISYYELLCKFPNKTIQSKRREEMRIAVVNMLANAGRIIAPANVSLKAGTKNHSKLQLLKDNRPIEVVPSVTLACGLKISKEHADAILKGIAQNGPLGELARIEADAIKNANNTVDVNLDVNDGGRLHVGK